MYVDINEVTLDSKKNAAIISGIDLDSILLNSWTEEFPEKAEVTFKFDLTSKGPRIYLYKILKSAVKEDTESFRTMEDRLMALNGKIVNISSNFLAKG